MNNHCHCNACPRCYHLPYFQHKQGKHVFNEDIYIPNDSIEEDQSFRGKKRKLFNEKKIHPTNINNHYSCNRHQSNNDNSNIQSGDDTRYRYTVNITCNKVPINNSNEKLDKTESIIFTFN